MKYAFVVAATFKNQELALEEWIEHYKFHGAEHIYLIDDDSTDNSLEVIKPYIESGFVTLFNANGWAKYLGRQRDMYNHFILPIVNNKVSKWTFICDLDEFLWSPYCIDIKKLLLNCSHLSQMQINHSQFGSSGHIEQPSCIVKYFTHKEETQSVLLKYFINSKYKFTSLNVHHATYENKSDSVGTFMIIRDYFRLNHYRIQSLHFWNNVKCMRGDIDNYLIRNKLQFHEMDKNEVEDLDLWQQNKDMEFYKNK
jgi:Glycosyl transferase family 2